MMMMMLARQITYDDEEEEEEEERGENSFDLLRPHNRKGPWTILSELPLYTVLEH